jgi:hypothetical protein
MSHLLFSERVQLYDKNLHKFPCMETKNTIHSHLVFVHKSGLIFGDNIVRQAERADFSKLMICQIFSTDVKKAGGG